MFSDYEPAYCDGQPLKERSIDFQEIYLPDIEQATGGIFSLAQLLKSGRILDIGCGSGALANALRKKGYRGKIIGVDAFGPYQGDTAYREYEELIFGDVRNEMTLNKIAKHEYDNAICVGLPPQACEFVLNNPGRFKLKKRGLLTVASDDIHSTPQQFSRYDGQYSAVQKIFLFRK